MKHSILVSFAVCFFVLHGACDEQGKQAREYVVSQHTIKALESDVAKVRNLLQEAQSKHGNGELASAAMSYAEALKICEQRMPDSSVTSHMYTLKKGPFFSTSLRCATHGLQSMQRLMRQEHLRIAIINEKSGNVESALLHYNEAGDNVSMQRMYAMNYVRRDVAPATQERSTQTD